MTGRELIIYIVENHLEDEIVLENRFFTGFITDEEAAVKFKVCVPTIHAWYIMGRLDGFRVGDRLYFLKNVKLKENDHE